MRLDQSITGPRRSRRAAGFTIIELLVVFAVIAILVSAVLVGGTTVLTKARVRNTKAVLQVVRDALEEYKRERPMIIAAHQPATGGGRVRYSVRYGEYPPDEVEVFTNVGLPGSTAGGSLAPGGAVFIPPPTSGAAISLPRLRASR